MAVAITINDKEYIFELDRANYRKYVLQDPEYSAIQTKLASLTKSKKDSLSKEAKNKKLNKEEIEEIASNAVIEAIYENDITLLTQINMIAQEKVFYASLVKNQADMTVDKAVKLLELAIDEYGQDEVDELCKELTANFTRKGEKTEKKKMVRRVV